MATRNMVNTKDWPICVVNIFPSTIDQTRLWLEEMDLLLAKRTPFVLIYPPRVKKEKPSTEDIECMKYVRRWLTYSKESMAQYCYALVITLQPDGKDQEEMTRLAPMLSELYGTKVLIAADAKRAVEKAHAILA